MWSTLASTLTMYFIGHTHCIVLYYIVLYINVKLLESAYMHTALGYRPDGALSNIQMNTIYITFTDTVRYVCICIFAGRRNG